MLGDRGQGQPYHCRGGTWGSHKLLLLLFIVVVVVVVVVVAVIVVVIIIVAVVMVVVITECEQWLMAVVGPQLMLFIAL